MRGFMKVLCRDTLVPIGVAVSVTVTFLYLTIVSVHRFTRLETIVGHQGKTDSIHTERLLKITEQMNRLNDNMIRQSEIMKKIEEKLK